MMFWQKTHKTKENTGNKDKKVFVGLSGGVDSSVVAYLLKKEKYDVVGVFIETWQPDFIKCSIEDDKQSAMSVAAFLDIPFVVLDLRAIYKEKVADYMINEYKLGRTPNPDILCNKEVKFGEFLKFAKNNGAWKVATGHYANILEKDNNFYLQKAKDESKDQSYFLSALDQSQLSQILFPLGNLKKKEVREIAKKAKLPTSQRKDSQGVCMLGDFDIKDFLAHYIKPEKGNVLNTKGETIGFHDGVQFLTLGERHGFTITEKTPNDKRYYILKKDLISNTITVATEDKKNIILNNSEKQNSSNIILIDNVNWINNKIDLNKKYKCQIRYHGEFLDCEIGQNEKDENKYFVKIHPNQIVANGQSIVFYENGNIDSNVLGRGVVHN